MRKTIFIASAVVMTAIVVLAQNVSTFTDKRDGQVYKTVKIGSQVWMAQNLNYDVPNVTTDVCYDDKTANCNKYGRLYNWETAKKACPAAAIANHDTFKKITTILPMSCKYFIKMLEKISKILESSDK